MRERLTALGVAVPALAPGPTRSRRGRVRAPSTAGRWCSRRPRRLRRQGRLGRGRDRGRRLAEALERRASAAGRGAGRLRARAGRAGGPLAARPGGGATRSSSPCSATASARGGRPGARPRRRAGRAGPARSRCAIAARARRDRGPGGGAVRDRRRPGAGQRAGDAPAQHRPLDHGRRGHQPVREPPARRARPAARARPRRRAVDGDGQHPRRRPTPTLLTTATRTCWPATRGCKVHLYGKEVRPGRKVGHVNAYGDDLDERCARARHAAAGSRDLDDESEDE